MLHLASIVLSFHWHPFEFEKKRVKECSYHLLRNAGTYLVPACSSSSSSECYCNLFSLSENLFSLKTNKKTKETRKTFLLSLPSSNWSSQCFSWTQFRTRNDSRCMKSVALLVLVQLISTPELHNFFFFPQNVYIKGLFLAAVNWSPFPCLKEKVLLLSIDYFSLLISETERMSCKWC